MTTSKSRIALAVLALVLTPTLALAHPTQSTGTRTHQTALHDRSPKLHEHGSQAHH